MADEAALGAEDYQVLHGMLLSEDAPTKAHGLALAKKLTPNEQQAFFDYQKTANAGKGELTRVDDQSPAILGAVGAGTAVTRAASAPGLSLVARGMAGTKAAVSQVTPILKYQVVKSGLEHMGVPGPAAAIAAMAATGYKGSSKSATVTTEAAPIAAEAAVAAPVVAANLSDVELARQEFAAGRLPKAMLDAVERKAAASAPVVVQAPPQAAPAPTSAPIAAPPSPQPIAVAAPAGGPPVASPAPAAPAPAPAAPQTPAQIANSIWKAARDAKVVLSPDENVAAFQAVKGGASPADAIASLKAPAAVAKATLTAPEAALMQKMRAAGKTDAEIAAAIQNNRAFIAQFGTPTPTAADTRFPKGMRGKPAGSD